MENCWYKVHGYVGNEASIPSALFKAADSGDSFVLSEDKWTRSARNNNIKTTIAKERGPDPCMPDLKQRGE